MPSTVMQPSQLLKPHKTLSVRHLRPVDIVAIRDDILAIPEET